MSLANIVGESYGSVFAIDGRALVKARPDDLVSGANAESVDDNRELLDSRENQALDSQTILDLKSQGASGKVCWGVL